MLDWSSGNGTRHLLLVLTAPSAPGWSPAHPAGVLLLAALATAVVFHRQRKQRKLQKLQKYAEATGVEPGKGSMSGPSMPTVAASATGTGATSYDSAMEAGCIDVRYVCLTCLSCFLS